MEFLQTKLCNQTKLNTASIKKRHKKMGNSAFITALFLPFLSLMLIGLMGLTGLSLGIKNITRSQSYCIKQALQTQKKLGKILAQLVKLNKTVSYMSTARKTADASLATAIASVVFIPKTPQLIKARNKIKTLQKALILKQKYLLTQSSLIRKQALTQLKQKLKKLKVNQVQDLTFYKKALAVQKEKIGSDAYIYKPVEDFKNHQKLTFQWSLPIFHPLNNSWPFFKNSYATYSCTSSLKQRGKKWISTLYH